MDPRLSDVPPHGLPGVERTGRGGGARPCPASQSAAVAMCGIQAGCRSREDGYEIEGYRPQPDEASNLRRQRGRSGLFLDRRHEDDRGPRV